MVAAPQLQDAVVTRMERHGSHFFTIGLRAGSIARQAEPGQFVMIAVHPQLAADSGFLAISSSWDPLLRRPFSIYRVNSAEEEIFLLGQATGRGSRILAAAVPGQVYSVLGPLGRPFRVEPGWKHLLLVGGGAGVAPLVFAGERFAARGIAVTVLFGFRNAGSVIGWEATSAWATSRYLVTEDGSAGKKGLVTDVLRRLLASASTTTTSTSSSGCDCGHGPAPTPARFDAILACGPAVMLKATAELARAAGVPCQVSAERTMGCGFGVCLSCVLPRPDGSYALVCQDGPVFASEEVDLSG
ncbi:MAG: dihydroorotate dehydrogenase electron transfer subunit [Limnochordales bacterium]|nr:dihydroorotate dehydrogenase electron transfer subunit [Limnochordales bacterium]